MKYILLLFVFASFSQITFAQELSGRYVSDNDLIDLDNNNIKFEIISDGGLIWTLRGQGTYYIVDDFIVIQTNEFNGKKSTVNKECNGQFGLKVVDISSGPMYAVNVGFYDSIGTVIDASATDRSGYIENKKYKITETIEVRYLGYDPVTFSYSPDCFFTVTLEEGKTIENSTVVFKITEQTENYVKLVLLNTNFKHNTPTLRQLKKLYRKSSKFKLRERKFEK